MIKNRLTLPRDALADLSEARRAAVAAKDYGELSNIAREASVVYAWRGNDRSAALELLQALAFASMHEDKVALARALAETGRIELEGGRYERAAMLFRDIAEGPAKDLPPRQAQRLKVNFCQALNRTGNGDQALAIARQLKSELPAEEARLAFLVRIEEARAFAARGQLDEAEKSLAEAEVYLADKSDAFRRLEYLETKGELDLLKGDGAAVDILEQVASEFTEQDLIARAANVRVKLASALFKVGRDDEAREALALALRSAIAADLTELADRIRSDMMKSDGGKHLKELAEDIELIGGGAGVSRRFIVLGRLGAGGGGQVDRALDLTDGEQVALKKVDLTAYSEEQRKRAIDSVRAEYACALTLTPSRGRARARSSDRAQGSGLYRAGVHRRTDAPPSSHARRDARATARLSRRRRRCACGASRQGDRASRREARQCRVARGNLSRADRSRHCFGCWFARWPRADRNAALHGARAEGRRGG